MSLLLSATEAGVLVMAHEVKKSEFGSNLIRIVISDYDYGSCILNAP